MAAELAPELLRWLASVLTPKYHNVNRTYSDSAGLLHYYRSLSPKTDVYTYDDGRSDLLLCIHGTLPVVFRGATYNIPLNIWVPHQYPSIPPTVIVVPGKNMGIRQTNHVDASGRCYHPYLAYWTQNHDKSSLLDLCGQLKDVFGKEPPLYTKQPSAAQPMESVAQTPPPPLPPLPQEIEAQRSRTNPASQAPRSPVPPTSPPPPPPKAELQQQSPTAYAFTTAPHLYDPNSQARPHNIASTQTSAQPFNPPTATEGPTLPQKVPFQGIASPQVSSPGYQQYRTNPPHSHPISPLAPANTTILPNPRSPPPPPHYQQPPQPGPSQHVWPPQPTPTAHRLSGQYDMPINRLPTGQTASPRPISFHGYPNQQVPIGPSKLGPTPPGQPSPKLNILDDDAGMLPVSVQRTAPPPLPPNPEKDRLINEIAKTLQQKVEAASVKTMTSLEQTASQAEAMAKTEAYMERERIELIRINDVCEKDQRILTERIAMADDLIRDVRDRDAPNIDSVVVGPTVVHNQLYELVTDDMAIEDTIYILGKALDKERITLDIFLKHTRALAREQFMKRALVKKISDQIGMNQ